MALYLYTFDSPSIHAEATLTETDARAVLDGRLQAGAAVSGNARLGWTIVGHGGARATMVPVS
jgi:hypothetical protein